MIKLIVNADDFGMNEGRTRSILECFERGVVSNTTIMVNMPYAEKATELARSAHIADRVGLHINLSEGLPLTSDIRQYPLFCNEDGCFNGRFHHSTITRLHLPGGCLSAVTKELEAQLDRYCELGLTERHIDSHHHSHTDYAVAKLLFPLAKERDFHSVRLSMNMVPGQYSGRKAMYKRLFNWWLTRQFEVRSDFFCDLDGFEAHVDGLSGKVVEIMVHPLRCANGFCDPADHDITEYETRVGDIENLLKRYSSDVELVSYKDL